MATRPAELPFIGPLRVLIGTLPFLLAIALVILVNLPVSFTGRLMPAPSLALAAVYYWVLVRPDLMPPAAVFVVGFLEDILSGGPPGLWAAGFLAAFFLTDRERDTLAGLRGIGAILGFAGSMLVAAMIAYGMLLAIYWRSAPVAPLLLEAAVTVMFYPFIAIAMGAVQRTLVGPLRHQE